MSTDDFTEAARKRAERRVPLDGGEPDLIFRDRRELVEMAEWARTYLAAQDPTEAEVEAAAIALCATGQNETIWQSLDPEERDAFRADARAALSAARATRRDEEKR